MNYTILLKTTVPYTLPNNWRVEDCIFKIPFTVFIDAFTVSQCTEILHYVLLLRSLTKCSFSVISKNRSCNKCTLDLSVTTHQSCKEQVNLCSPHAKQDAKPTGHICCVYAVMSSAGRCRLVRWLYSSERRLTACRNKGNGSEAIALLISMERHIMRHPSNNTF